MGSAMPTHEDLVQLARICARHARGATNKDVATVLWKMAENYQMEAVKLDSDKSPDIGAPPARIEGVPIGIGSITTYQFQSSSGLSSARCWSGTCHGDCLDCR